MWKSIKEGSGEDTKDGTGLGELDGEPVSNTEGFSEESSEGDVVGDVEVRREGLFVGE